MTCYHNYAIKNLSDKFFIIGKTIDNNIEIAINQKFEFLGLMFHPERKNQFNKFIKKMLKNFIFCFLSTF